MTHIKRNIIPQRNMRLNKIIEIEIGLTLNKERIINLIDVIEMKKEQEKGLIQRIILKSKIILRRKRNAYRLLWNKQKI